MSRVVRPEIHTIPISQGDTLVVKRRLNAGEQRDAFARMSTYNADGDRRIDRLQVGIALTVAYLLDWSVKDDDDKVIPIRGQSPEFVTAALRSLDPESFDEINEAVELYDATIRKAQAAAKNGQDGANGSPAISPSPDGAVGDTSGSQSLTLTSMTS